LNTIINKLNIWGFSINLLNKSCDLNQIFSDIEQLTCLIDDNDTAIFINEFTKINLSRSFVDDIQLYLWNVLSLTRSTNIRHEVWVIATIIAISSRLRESSDGFDHENRSVMIAKTNTRLNPSWVCDNSVDM
jgi:hypothetical protein